MCIRDSDHIVYALVLIGLAQLGAGSTLGFGARWDDTYIVRRHAWRR